MWAGRDGNFERTWLGMVMVHPGQAHVRVWSKSMLAQLSGLEGRVSFTRIRAGRRRVWFRGCSFFGEISRR